MLLAYDIHVVKYVTYSNIPYFCHNACSEVSYIRYNAWNNTSYSSYTVLPKAAGIRCSVITYVT